MNHSTTSFLRRAGPNEQRLFANPTIWPQWPYLPVLRLQTDERPEFGLLYDAEGYSDKSGHQTTVFCATPADIALQESRFLKLPRHIYESVDELAAAGWIVDWNLLFGAAGPIAGPRFIPLETPKEHHENTNRRTAVPRQPIRSRSRD